MSPYAVMLWVITIPSYLQGMNIDSVLEDEISAFVDEDECALAEISAVVRHTHCIYRQYICMEILVLYVLECRTLCTRCTSRLALTNQNYSGNWCKLRAEFWIVVVWLPRYCIIFLSHTGKISQATTTKTLFHNLLLRWRVCTQAPRRPLFKVYVLMLLTAQLHILLYMCFILQQGLQRPTSKVWVDSPEWKHLESMLQNVFSNEGETEF